MPSKSKSKAPVDSSSLSVATSSAASQSQGSTSTLAVPNDSNRDRILRMSSMQRQEKDPFYKVDALDKILKEELKNHTYKDDSRVLLNLFPQNVITEPDSVVMETALRAISSVPKPLQSFVLKGHGFNTMEEAIPLLNTQNQVQTAVSSNRASRSKGGGNSNTSRSGTSSISGTPSGSTLSRGSSDTGIEKGATTPNVVLPSAESTDPTDEDDLRDWLNVFSDLVYKFCSKRHRRRFNSSSKSLPMKGTSPEKRKPDILLIHEDRKSEDTNVPWPVTRAIIEYTRTEKFPPRLKAEPPQRAALLLKDSPTRRFAPIVLISGGQFMVSVYHRSGVNHSKKYDFATDLIVFYHIIANLVFCDDELLGLDPNVTFKEPDCTLHTIMFKGEIYEVNEVLFSSEGIQCRGTVCLSVTHSVTRRKYVLKMSWIELQQGVPTEVDFYEMLDLWKIKGVPVMIGYEDVDVSDGKDTTGRWKPAGKADFQVRTYRRILLDGIGRRFTDFSSRKELLSATADILKSLYSLFSTAKILHQDISLANMLLIDRYPEYGESRKDGANSPHSASVDKPESAPSISSGHSIVSVEQNLTGLSIDETEQSGGDSKADPNHPVLARGLLSDFDLALLLSKLIDMELRTMPQNIFEYYTHCGFLKNASGLTKLRTGTATYMAIQVLLGCDGETYYEHSLINDVESVIYGLIKISVHYYGPHNRIRDFKEMPIKDKSFSGTKIMITQYWSLLERNFADLGMTKSFTWSHMKQCVLPAIHTYFAKFGDMFEEINDVLFPYGAMKKKDYDLRINSPAKIEDIIKIVEKYRDMMPDDDNFVPPPSELKQVRRSARLAEKESAQDSIGESNQGSVV